MEMVLIFTFCLILARTDAAITVTGYKGRSVQIECSYDSGYEDYNKYLCRRDCYNWDVNDIPVQSESSAKDPRFSLYDDTTANVFTVTITDLRTEDEGTYWCGIDWRGRDSYTEFKLIIKIDDRVLSTQSTPTTHPTLTHIVTSSVHTESTLPPTDFSTILVTHYGYIMTGAGAVLFAVAVIIGMYCTLNHLNGSKTVSQLSRETKEGQNDLKLLHVKEREKTLPESVYQDLDPSTKQSDSLYHHVTFTNN
ncbi:CMRF35-like molecule 3 [Clarias gariepinus]|uniref:CMRF35-like molecule 3 n=1 Tax=Clarias gariepinus TaxID=13013 RepID=UPI00234C452A|nr:CMRF35-like molecule 3 [Clarias gariepinus]